MEANNQATHLPPKTFKKRHLKKRRIEIITLGRCGWKKKEGKTTKGCTRNCMMLRDGKNVVIVVIGVVGFGDDGGGHQRIFGGGSF